MIWHKFRFEAAHQLPKLPPSHKCSRLHGHSYLVTLELRGEVDEYGFVVDYDDLGKAWQRVNDVLDHRFLNEIDGLEVPTTEVLANWILVKMKCDYFASAFHKLVAERLVAVNVAESFDSEARAHVDDR